MYINFHQNYESVTNLHVRVFIKDPINITLETQNKKSVELWGWAKSAPS